MRIDNYEEERNMIGFPTGFKNLDTLTGGLQGADVVILAAPSFVEEASLSLSIALNAGTCFQRRIGLFSLEMNRYQVVQRLLAMSAGIDLYRLRTGQLSEEESKQLSTAGKNLAKSHLWIDDRIGPSMIQLEQRVRQLVEIHDIDLIIVDNIHLIDRRMTNKAYEYQTIESSEIGPALQNVGSRTTSIDSNKIATA
jgi:replicative DNA helicase